MRKNAKNADRDLVAFEKRRREGMRLLRQGLPQVEVARRCGVARCSALRWERMLKKNGRDAWKRLPTGRRPKLTPEQWEQVERLMKKGGLAYGFPSNLWTLARVAELIRRHCKVRISTGQLWRIYGRRGWRAAGTKGKGQVFGKQKRKTKRK